MFEAAFVPVSTIDYPGECALSHSNPKDTLEVVTSETCNDTHPSIMMPKCPDKVDVPLKTDDL